MLSAIALAITNSRLFQGWRFRKASRMNASGCWHPTFERTSKGDGIYSVNVMVDRTRIHRVIGRESDGTTRTQCEVWIDKIRTAAREDRLALPKGRKVALSFADAGKTYIEKLGEEGGKGIPRKKRQLELYLSSVFGPSRCLKSRRST